MGMTLVRDERRKILDFWLFCNRLSINGLASAFVRFSVFVFCRNSQMRDYFAENDYTMKKIFLKKNNHEK